EIELAPVGIAVELLDRARDHRATPDHGVGALRQEHIHGHDLDATCRAQRLDALRSLLGGAAHAELLGNARSSDVAVQDANLQTLALKRDGDQARDQRLTYTALAAHHGDNVTDLAARRAHTCHRQWDAPPDWGLGRWLDALRLLPIRHTIEIGEQCLGVKAVGA